MCRQITLVNKRFCGGFQYVAQHIALNVASCVSSLNNTEFILLTIDICYENKSLRIYYQTV